MQYEIGASHGIMLLSPVTFFLTTNVVGTGPSGWGRVLYLWSRFQGTSRPRVMLLVSPIGVGSGWGNQGSYVETGTKRSARQVDIAVFYLKLTTARAVT